MQLMFAAKMNPMHSILVMIFSNLHPRPAGGRKDYLRSRSDGRSGRLEEDDWLRWQLHLQLSGVLRIVQAYADYLAWAGGGQELNSEKVETPIAGKDCIAIIDARQHLAI
jgi:hypothetical protein